MSVPTKQNRKQVIVHPFLLLQELQRGGDSSDSEERGRCLLVRAFVDAFKRQQGSTLWSNCVQRMFSQITTQPVAKDIAALFCGGCLRTVRGSANGALECFGPCLSGVRAWVAARASTLWSCCKQSCCRKQISRVARSGFTSLLLAPQSHSARPSP